MLLYADDIVLFCENIKELESILTIYDNTFTRFGLTIALDKTKTIVFNVDESCMSSKTLIYLRDTPIDNVRQFKYLGHMLSNENSQTFLNHQIASAYSFFSGRRLQMTDK